jgi:hypothetical protein
MGSRTDLAEKAPPAGSLGCDEVANVLQTPRRDELGGCSDSRSHEYYGAIHN